MHFQMVYQQQLETLRGVKDKLNTDKGRCNHDMNELVSKAKFFEGND